MREIESAVRELLLSGIPQPPKAASGKRRRNTASNAIRPPADAHVTQVKAILIDFGIPLESPPALYWIELATKGSKESLHRRAHRNDLGHPRPIDTGLQDAWDSLLRLLDELLDRFESRYTASVYDRLDRLAQVSAPSSADVATLKTRLPHTDATHRYFFGKVSSAGWLLPLNEAGFFDNPPEPIQDEDGSIQLPGWPQAEYLARVSEEMPAEVSEIIAKVKTQNPRVQWQLVEIASRLPAGHGVKLVPVVRTWIPELRRFEFVDPLLQFITVLSDGGCGDESLSLLAELYDVEDKAP